MQIQNSPVVTNNLGLAKVNLQRQKGARSLLAPGEGEDIFTPPQQSEINQMQKQPGRRKSSNVQSNQSEQSAEAISQGNQPKQSAEVK